MYNTIYQHKRLKACFKNGVFHSNAILECLVRFLIRSGTICNSSPKSSLRNCQITHVYTLLIIFLIKWISLCLWIFDYFNCEFRSTIFCFIFFVLFFDFILLIFRYTMLYLSRNNIFAFSFLFDSFHVVVPLYFITFP